MLLYERASPTKKGARARQEPESSRDLAERVDVKEHSFDIADPPEPFTDGVYTLGIALHRHFEAEANELLGDSNATIKYPDLLDSYRETQSQHARTHLTGKSVVIRQASKWRVAVVTSVTPAEDAERLDQIFVLQTREGAIPISTETEIKLTSPL